MSNYFSNSSTAIFVGVIAGALIILLARRFFRYKSVQKLHHFLTGLQFQDRPDAVPGRSWLTTEIVKAATFNPKTPLAMTGLIGGQSISVFLYNFTEPSMTSGPSFGLSQNTIIEVPLSRPQSYLYLARRHQPWAWWGLVDSVWNFVYRPEVDITPPQERSNLRELSRSNVTTKPASPVLIKAFLALPQIWDLEINDNTLFLLSSKQVTPKQLTTTFNRLPSVTASVEGSPTLSK